MNKLCECGCGLNVKNDASRFLRGHMFKAWKNNLDFQNKIKNGIIKKYGVDNPFKSDEVKEKIKLTNLQRYGVDNPFKDKEKIKQSILKKYGVNNPSQLEKIKEKKKKTSLKHFGVTEPLHSKEVQEKIKQILIQKYGVDNISKTEKNRQKYRENYIKLIENQKLNGEPLGPRIGNFERTCLDELQHLLNYNIIRNQQIIGYFPDGYIKELNLIIEFYESWHHNNWCIKKDIQRQHDLINHLKCNFFIIWQKDWKENKDQVIESFKLLINEQKLKESINEQANNSIK
jgi:very-short-patch-repair endonuclease